MDFVAPLGYSLGVFPDIHLISLSMILLVSFIRQDYVKITGWGQGHISHRLNLDTHPQHL